MSIPRSNSRSGLQLFAQDTERFAHGATVGERGDAAQLIRALAQVLVHALHGDPASLCQCERLARVDRGKLLTVADHHEAVDPKRIGDSDQMAHRCAADHRGFVEHEDRALEFVPGPFVALSPPRERMSGIGVDERRHRLRLDPRALAQIADHLVLKGEAQHLATFGFGNPGNAGDHGRLAGARDALHGNDPIGRGQRQRGSGHLPGVQCLVPGRVGQPHHHLVGRDDWFGSRLPRVDLGQDLRLSRERFGRGDMRHDPVDPVGLSRDQLFVADEFADARVDLLGRDPCKPEIERSAGDLGHRKRRLTLLEDADSRGDRVLRAIFRGGQAEPVEAAIDQRVAWAENAADRFPDAGQNLVEAPLGSQTVFCGARA